MSSHNLGTDYVLDSITDMAFLANEEMRETA